MPDAGRRLILMDGTQIEDGSCGYADRRLWCYVKNYTMPQAAQVFLDPSKTGKIIFQYGDMSDEYDGFTYCTNIFLDEDQVSVCLRKGVQDV